MNRLPFFKFDVRLWLTGSIQVCSVVEKGTFIDLCALIWNEQTGRLENNDLLHRRLRVEKGTFKDALSNLIKFGLIQENDGVLSVKFITNQIKEHNEFIDKCSEAGKKGGRPKRVPKAKKKEERREKKEDKKEIVKKSFKEWTEEGFRDNINESKKDYPQPMIDDFFRYWTEPDPKGKMRFQLERTWSTAGRLATWQSNNFNKNAQPKPKMKEFGGKNA